jgi:serine/threonine protein phosphatase 1
MNLRFSKRRKVDSAGSVCTSAGERVYAIGDIHGRYDLLLTLLGKIQIHHASLPKPKNLRLIILGDFIDRGPESANIIHLLQNATIETDMLTVLLGNHEDLMLNSLAGDGEAQTAWLRYGGDATLSSFGIDPTEMLRLGPRAAAAAMRKVIAQPVIDWLRTRPVMTRSGDYIFCHAGLRPGVPVAEQAREDLLWIGADFLESSERFENSVVVHGHSTFTTVEQRTNRIGIDTGAYRTGVLTALYLEGTERATFST